MKNITLASLLLAASAASFADTYVVDSYGTDTTISVVAKSVAVNKSGRCTYAGVKLRPGDVAVMKGDITPTLVCASEGGAQGPRLYQIEASAGSNQRAAAPQGNSASSAGFGGQMAKEKQNSNVEGNQRSALVLSLGQLPERNANEKQTNANYRVVQPGQASVMPGLGIWFYPQSIEEVGDRVIIQMRRPYRGDIPVAFLVAGEGDKERLELANVVWDSAASRLIVNQKFDRLKLWGGADNVLFIEHMAQKSSALEHRGDLDSQIATKERAPQLAISKGAIFSCLTLAPVPGVPQQLVSHVSCQVRSSSLSKIGGKVEFLREARLDGDMVGSLIRWRYIRSGGVTVDLDADRSMLTSEVLEAKLPEVLTVTFNSDIHLSN